MLVYSGVLNEHHQNVSSDVCLFSVIYVGEMLRGWCDMEYI